MSDFTTMTDWASASLGTCEVCSSGHGNYRCPRCGVVYCSIECFKRHSERCRQEFGKEAAKAVPNRHANFETRTRMRQILERVDDEKLHPQTEVEPWKAWWDARVVGDAPTPVNDPPPKFSPLLKYHLINVMYGYCYIMRLYNGDVSFDVEGACDAMITISSVLTTKQVFTSVREALKSCIESSMHSDLFIEYQWQVEVVHDVELCLQTRNHVYKVLSESLGICRGATPEPKLSFFYAWSQTITPETLTELRSSVHEYYTSLSSLLSSISCQSTP